MSLQVRPCHLVFFVGLLVLLFLRAPLAAQSCCDTSSVVTLCYISAADYCALETGSCSAYSLDGDFMVNSLRSKLLNPFNFGPNGVVNCPIVLHKLGAVSSVQAIEAQGCKMIFVPTVLFNIPNTSQLSSDETQMPTAILDTIRAWSMVCPQNLVIVTQAESRPWGYNVENLNQNPNVPAPGGAGILNIFDGPFGVVNQFNQGGTWQGVITQLPATGAEILAQDAQGRPTVALDAETQDLILGDIGFFCSGGAGPISNGPNVNNNNDRFALNIFALACQLANDPTATQLTVVGCEGQEAIGPTGQILEVPGVYFDTLVSFAGCDSILRTEYIWEVIPAGQVDRIACSGSGEHITLGGVRFDEDNPSGQVTLTSVNGCDSVVQVSMTFLPNNTGSQLVALCPGQTHTLLNGQSVSVPGMYADTTTSFNGCDSVLTVQVIELPQGAGVDIRQLCLGDSYVLSSGQLVTTPGTYVDTLIAFNGCDSILSLDISFLSDTSRIDRRLCAGDSVSNGFQWFFPGEVMPLFLQNEKGCDSIVLVDLVLISTPPITVPPLVLVPPGARDVFQLSIPPGSAVVWSPPDGLDCPTCPHPLLDVQLASSAYEVSITDRDGCVWIYSMTLDFQCEIYVPNALSANYDGINDELQLGFSPCRYSEFVFRVYDRWGNEVFFSRDPDYYWDGTFNGRLLDPGVYVWTLEVLASGQKLKRAGELHLLR